MTTLFEGQVEDTMHEFTEWMPVLKAPPVA